MEEESEEKSVMSVSSPEGAENSEKLVADLTIESRLLKSKFDETKSENDRLKIKLQEMENNVFESVEVQNLVREYENQIKCLKESISVSGQGNWMQKTDEINKLTQRNNILAHTNAHAMRQLEMSNKEKKKLENDLNKLKEELYALQTSSNTKTKEDSSEQQNTKSSEKKSDESVNKRGEIDTACPADENLDQSQYIELLRKYLGEYCQLVVKSQLAEKNTEKRNQALEESNRKLTGQLQIIVKERDDLVLMHKAQKQTFSGFQSTSSSTNAQSPVKEYKPQHSSSTEYDIAQQEHYKILAIEYRDKCKTLEQRLSENETHTLEQEVKIQKLMIRYDEVQKERDAARMMLNDQGSQASFEEVSCLRRTIQEKDKHIAELVKSNQDLQEKLGTLQSESESGETFAYEAQMKAFQDDYFAEREEKKKIIEEKQRLQMENEKMRLELNRPLHPVRFSSPPAGPNPTFEAMLRSPPTEYTAAHQSGTVLTHNSGTAMESIPSLPNAGHGQQVADYAFRNPNHVPSHGTIPNTSVSVYQASQTYPHTQTTIPPRGQSQSQPQMYHDNFPQSPPTDQQAYFMAPVPSYMSNIPGDPTRYQNPYPPNARRQVQQGTRQIPNNQNYPPHR